MLFVIGLIGYVFNLVTIGQLLVIIALDNTVDIFKHYRCRKIEDRMEEMKGLVKVKNEHT